MKSPALRRRSHLFPILSAALLAVSARGATTLPVLEVTRQADPFLRVAWTNSTPGFVLESTDALGGAWQPVPAVPTVNQGVASVVVLAGDAKRFFRLRSDGLLVTVLDSNPSAGEGGVAVTRETVLRLTGPLAPGTVPGPNTLYAGSAGRRILSRVEIGADRSSLTLFYLENLPANARVNVVFDGTGLVDAGGNDVDADGDGTPGGVRTLSFDTLGIAGLPGTGVEGHVYASEKLPDGKNKPLVGVTVTVDGAEETLRTTTDEAGFFRLLPVPAGRFFVHVDGRTADGSRWPSGDYYPYVGKAWTAVPGRSNNVAGEDGLVFLPLVPGDALTAVKSTEATKVTFSSSLVATNPALAGVEVNVPANSLLNANGARGGRVGIAPVAPDRLPEKLPAGLNFPLVITIQTDGPANFDQPVPVKFPNLPDPKTGLKLPPGAKTALWSFNHDTGRWEIQGSMTISADGLFAVSDAGVGVRQPGWHGVNPGNQGFGPPAKENNDECEGPDPCVGQRLAYLEALEDYLDLVFHFGATDKNVINEGRKVDNLYDFYQQCRLENGDECGNKINSAMTSARPGARPQGLTGEAQTRFARVASQLEQEQERRTPYHRLPSAGDYYLIRSLETGFVLRGRMNAQGFFDPVILAPNEAYSVSYFDPVNHRLGRAYFVTTGPGESTIIPAVLEWHASGSGLPDADADGLSDAAEDIVGTSPNKADTDGDGMSDGVELATGGDPSDGFTSAIGLINEAAGPGGVLQQVASTGDFVVAGGTSGQLAIYDARVPAKPVLLGAVSTGHGIDSLAADGGDVAVFSAGGYLTFVRLAADGAGKIVWTSQVTGPGAVALRGGRVYAGNSEGIRVLDAADGHPLGQVPFRGEERLVVYDGFLYALGADGLGIFTIDGATLTARGVSPAPGDPTQPIVTTRELAVARGYAYIGNSLGYRTIDVRDPAAPAPVTPVGTVAVGAVSLAHNGSHHVVGTFRNGGNSSIQVMLYDASQPDNPTNFVSGWATTGSPRGVRVHRGMALVADSEAGLASVNFLGPDTGTNAPNIQARARVSLPGNREEARRLFVVTADATDDVMVRDVEVYLDGVSVARVGGYPFELTLPAPAWVPGKTNFKVRCLATDTGGNSSWSNELLIGLEPDSTAPQVAGFSPAGGTVALRDTLGVVAATFSEEIQPGSLAGAFQLREAGVDGQSGTADDTVVAGTISYLPGTDRTARLTLSQKLQAGRYRFSVSTALTDLFGNHLGAVASSDFVVVGPNTYTPTKNNRWAETVNWSFAKVPTANDFVVIAASTAAAPAWLVQATGQARTLDLSSPLLLGDTNKANQNLAGNLVVGATAELKAPVRVYGQSTLSGAGVYHNLSTLEFLGSGGSTLDDARLVNDGIVRVDKAYGTGDLKLSGAARLVNNPGKVFELAGDSGVTGVVSDAATFENAGRLIHRGPEQSRFAPPHLIHSGQIEVLEGALELNLPVNSSSLGGSLLAETGTRLRIVAPNCEFGPNSRVYGNGQVEVTSSSRFLGTFEPAGLVQLSGGPRFTGPVRLPGEVQLLAGGSATFAGAPVQIRSLSNTLAQAFFSAASEAQVGQAWFVGSGVSASTLSVDRQMRITGPLVTYGKFALTGSGRLAIDGPVLFGGAVDGAATSTMEFYGLVKGSNSVNVSVPSGRFVTRPGSELQLDNIASLTLRTLEHHGVMRLDSAVTRSVKAGLVGDGLVDIAKGQLDLEMTGPFGGELRSGAGTTVRLMFINALFETNSTINLQGPLVVTTGRGLRSALRI